MLLAKACVRGFVSTQVATAVAVAPRTVPELMCNVDMHVHDALCTVTCMCAQTVAASTGQHTVHTQLHSRPLCLSQACKEFAPHPSRSGTCPCEQVWEVVVVWGILPTTKLANFKRTSCTMAPFLSPVIICEQADATAHTLCAHQCLLPDCSARGGPHRWVRAR